MSMKQLWTAAALTVGVQTSALGLTFEHVMTIGSEGDGEGQLQYVEDFAFSAEGHLLVTDAAHAFVQAFNRTTGEFVARFGGQGDFDENLDKPEGIAVDSAGNIFVADYNTGEVKKYDQSFNLLLSFSEYGEAPGQLRLRARPVQGTGGHRL